MNDAFWKLVVRRIGFTAGLEDIYERSMKLAKLVSKDFKFNNLIWRKLARDNFNKKTNSAADEMANPYNQLAIINKQYNKLFIGPTLESLIIMNAVFENNDSQFETASRLIILSNIIYSDGEIFLNILSKNFSHDGSKALLKKMVEKKYNILEGKYKFIHKRSREIVWNAIQIKSNKKTVQNIGEQLEISDAFISHTLSPRKGWAKSLGLWDPETKEINLSTIKLLDKLKKIPSISAYIPVDENDHPFIIFPSADVLGRDARFLNATKEDPLLTTNLKEIIQVIGESFPSGEGSLSEDEAIDLIKKIYSVYTNKVRRDKIRKQIPIPILRSSYSAYIFASNYEKAPELDDVLKTMHEMSLISEYALRGRSEGSIHLR